MVGHALSAGRPLYTREWSIVRIGYRERVTTVRRTDPDRVRLGLCADCLYARRIESARRSAFYQCQRSPSDPRFPKYPPLPVNQCDGHEPCQVPPGE